MSKVTQQPEKQTEIPLPPGSDMEDGGAKGRPESHFRGLSDVQKWRKEDWMKKGVLVLVLRAFALLFSFLSFIIMVVIPNFQLSEPNSYVFSIALITMVYTAIQVGIKGHELRIGKDIISSDVVVWIDFIGDQVMTYMLLSSASTGAMNTNLARNMGYVNPIVEKESTAVAMAFLAFFSLASASLISGYHLFTELSRS
ncbi:CASP-like protein 4B1 [Chenopodium quinoa]|uniref:CASP-like protein n=1 Tax=Chenopodium quinoa TaxID=63459 RepID=A0A803L350_CHEQI|nr:CASP-like protein 4B1 [Chenopodium quinoa]